MITDEYLFSRIGMALISAQRVEFVTAELVTHLAEFDREIYGITTDQFFSNSSKALKARKMLGEIFGLLKLNPKLVIEKELAEYLKRRNLFVHSFWKQYLNNKSQEQAQKAVDFCNEFGLMSQEMESFFKGFIYFLALRHVKDRYHLSPLYQEWAEDFDIFMLNVSVNNKTMHNDKI